MDVCIQKRAAHTVEAAIDSTISAEALSMARRIEEHVMLVLAHVIELFLKCHRAGVEIGDAGPHTRGYNDLIIIGRFQRPSSILWIDWESRAKRPTPKRSMLNKAVRPGVEQDSFRFFEDPGGRLRGRVPTLPYRRAMVAYPA